MAKKRKVVHVDDDEWCTIEWVGQREMCCGCGLRHVVDYRVVEDEYLPGVEIPMRGKLQFRAKREGG